MAGQTKVNPSAMALNVENLGKDIQIFTIDYINAINGSAGPLGAQNAVLNTVMTTATIVAQSALGNSNTEQTFWTEGTDNVVVATSPDGTVRELNAEEFAAEGFDLKSQGYDLNFDDFNLNIRRPRKYSNCRNTFN